MKSLFKLYVLVTLMLLLQTLPTSAQLRLLPNQIGIGNTAPDEPLVIGDNITDIGFIVPAMTIGNTDGGALALGNNDYRLEMSAFNTDTRVTLSSTNPTGSGQGEIAIRANGGLAIGEDPGSANGYMIRAVHNALGILLERSGTNQNWELFTNSNGPLELYHNETLRGRFDNSTGVYSAISDRRLKRGIADLEPVLERVMQLQPSRYRYIAREKDSRQAIGFIAQDVEPLFPEVVYISEGERTAGTYTLDYAGFGPIAIKAIQELKSEIDAKDNRIAELEDRLDRIEKMLNEGQTAQNYLTLANGSAVPKPPILQQNRPNPFQSVTTITYTLPEQVQHAQLRIADPNGKLLRSMDIEQRGEVQTVLDAGGLPAGAYYYSLWADGEMVGSKKMILNK